MVGNSLHESKSPSWHLDRACSRHLTSEQKIFVSHLTEFSTKIKYANRDFLFAKGAGKIRLSYVKEDGSVLSITINDVLYIPEAKRNLFSLGQLSKRGVDMKSTGVRIYLH